MSIQSTLTALAADVESARNAITAKGGTVTAGGGTSQLASDINTIPAGGGGGYKLYLYHRVESDDAGMISINETDEYQLAQNMPDSSVTASAVSHMIGKVESFRLWGFDHIGSYPGGGSSWARYRTQGEAQWTNITLTRTKDSSALITLTGDTELEIMEHTCLAKGTLITMSDGTYKPVEEIEIGDCVMGYDGRPNRVRKSQKGCKMYLDYRDTWIFEGGHRVVTTGNHEFYNIERGKMTYLCPSVGSDSWEIGEHGYTENGERVALLQHIREDIPLMHFSLWCENENYFANGLLAGNRFTQRLDIGGD